MAKPRLLICTPELVCTPKLVFDIPECAGDVAGKVMNFKTGGMAEITSIVVSELARDQDIVLDVVVPQWKSSFKQISDFTNREVAALIEALHDYHVHLIEDASFNRVQISGSNTLMYDGTWRFTVVDRAIAYNRGIINWIIRHVDPDIVWVNDWVPGLVPAAVKNRGILSLATIHNIFTQEASVDRLVKEGIDIREFSDYVYYSHRYNENGQKPVDFLATEIFASDFITTVSPNFMIELEEGKYADRMSPWLLQQIINKCHAGRAKGILNPRDENVPNLIQEVGSASLEEVINRESETSVISRRLKNTKGLRDRLGLRQVDGPLIIYSNRLHDEKNPGLLLRNAQRLVDRYGVQFIINANGLNYYERSFGEAAVVSNGMIAYSNFDASIEDAAMFCDGVYGLMTPDREPCGAPNIKYPPRGVLVIAHEVGGIKDSVFSLDWEKGTGNGFVYKPNTDDALFGIMGVVVDFHHQTDEVRYRNLIRIAKESIESHSVRKMVDAYKEIIFQLYDEKSV